MDRLIVCGWDDGAEALLEALRVHANLRPTAVGDTHTASLVRARSATRLSCYQHVRQMVDSLEFDAALIGTSELATELASHAADRGAAILLRGDHMDALALETAANAAALHGVPLAVLRPAIRNAGFTFLTELVAADPHWVPAVLDIEVRDPGPAAGSLRDALAVATRLLGAMPMSVVASAAGLDTADPLALSAHLHYADGSLVTLAGRSGVAPGMRIAMQAPAGTLELRAEQGQSRFSITPWRGNTEKSVQRDAPGIDLEAERVARVRSGDRVDAQLVQREAAILRAIEEALTSGAVEAVTPVGARSSFRVLPGGVEASSPPIGALHLV